MGRLQPHDTRAKAQAELDGTMRQLAQVYPETNANMRGEVIPFWLAPRGPQRLLASSLAILQGIMLLLLLAVCANTANLMLARTSTRVREIGVRLSIGAGPWRVASLLLTENLVLAFLGACLGAAIAVWGTDALRAVPMIGAFPIKFQTRVDVLGLAFAMLLGLLCGLIFGMLPAAQLARINPQRGPSIGFGNSSHTQPASKRAHGSPSRTRADGAGCGGPVFPQLPGDPRYGYRLPARWRVAGCLRPDGT